MNKVILMGRLTRDPEIRTFHDGQTSVCSFTLAVDRRFKGAGGNREADFIACVAWRQQADFLVKYFKRGTKIGVIGELRSRSWEDETGRKNYATEVQAEELYFVEKKEASGRTSTTVEEEPEVIPLPDPVQDCLPFDL